MPRTPAKSSKPKLTDAERHARFKEMARTVDASEDPKAFDKAFDGVTRPITRESSAQGNS